MTTHKDGIYRFSGFSFNADSLRLTHETKSEININFSQAKILLTLLKNHGAIVSYNELSDGMWGKPRTNLQREIDEGARMQISSRIGILRLLLHNYEPETDFIITIARKGYIFNYPATFSYLEADPNNSIYNASDDNVEKSNPEGINTKEIHSTLDNWWFRLKSIAGKTPKPFAPKTEELIALIATTHPGIAGKIVIKDPYRLKGTLLNGKYLLEGYLGGGGMGAVYLASQTDSDELVAVKILKPDVFARNPEYVRLFDLEVESARKLDHPNIVNIFDNGADDDISYMVMELLEGNTLEDVIISGNSKIDFVANAFRQICKAFIAAHEQNVIHLDIKPANIFIMSTPQQENIVKVIDFGLAKVLSSDSGTTVTRVKGTDKYCSPEHFGGKLTKQSDIYSLGATLYNMLTGVIPFGNSYVMAKMYPNWELPPVPSILAQNPDLPKGLDKVIEKALSKDPADRQQSVRQLLDEFEQALSESEKA